MLDFVMQHPLARMLPMFRYQAQVYRMGERVPPSALTDHGPMWESVEFLLDPLDTLQARVNLQRDFTLLAIMATCTTNTAAGGFRVQFYDLKKRYRFADRPVNFANFAGTIEVLNANSPSPFFLREPYRFEIPDSQILLECQNFENAANTVSVMYYGQVLRFNAPGLTFPGGTQTGWDWADSVERFYQQAHHRKGWHL